MDPRAKKDFVADFDFEFDEKHKTVAVTERGVKKAEQFLGIPHLYTAENGHLVNHLQQSLKAESLYKRGVDYEVIDGEVKIIDEFTGRILEGRRWSEACTRRSRPRRTWPSRRRTRRSPPSLCRTTSAWLREARRHDRNGADRGLRVS